MVRVREFKSMVDGPHLLIFGAVHGNEVCGTRALEKICAELESGRRKLLRGRCTLVPICNEKAYVEGRRFVEENLNRVFHAHPDPTSHERKIANQLHPLVDRCDYLLDLHSMQSEGEPFAFLNRAVSESEKFCRALGLKWIMKGWPELYREFPDHLSSCTQTYADSKNKPNALVECGTNGHPDADEVAYRSALRGLAYLGLIAPDSPVSEVEPKFLRLTDLWFRQSIDDHFVKVWKNFEAVRRGDLIGHRASGEAVFCPRDGFIVFPSPVSAVGTEWVYVAVSE